MGECTNVKGFKKNPLTLLTLCMCVFFPVWFLSLFYSLWPFNGCYWNWLNAIFIIDSQCWGLQ